jgi:hypothetical protein
MSNLVIYIMCNLYVIWNMQYTLLSITKMELVFAYLFV